MLLNALNELAHGVSFEKVLKRYRLNRKGKKLKIVDKRRNAISQKPPEKLHEVLAGS